MDLLDVVIDIFGKIVSAIMYLIASILEGAMLGFSFLIYVIVAIVWAVIAPELWNMFWIMLAVVIGIIFLLSLPFLGSRLDSRKEKITK